MNPPCGANTASGPCQQPAVDGGTRCYAHGGRGQLKRLRSKALVGEAEEEFHAALADPTLMDLRRPVAMTDAVLRRTPLFATEEMAERAAKRRIAREIGFDLIRGWWAQIDDDVREKEGEDFAAAMRKALETFLTPTEGDLDLETLAIHERSQKLIAGHAKAQVDAAKALDWAATARETIFPVLGELSNRFATLLRKHVEPGKVGAAIDEMAVIIKRTVGELAEVKDKL